MAIKVRKEDLSFYDKLMMVNARVPLSHLNELFLQVKTLSEGETLLALEDLFIKTKDGKHYFILPISCQIEMESVTFWEIKNGQGMAIGKEFYPFPPRK